MDFGEAEGGTMSKELTMYHFLFGLIQFIAALVQLIIFSFLYTGLREREANISSSVQDWVNLQL